MGINSLHSRLKALILAAARPDVDVITASFVIKPIVPGETVTSLIVDRLAQVYQKPMFFTVTAASSATTDNISDLGTGQHVFGIMGYAPPTVWGALYGVRPPLRDNDPDSGGEGPAINGAIKPDFLAPFYQLAANNCVPAQWEVDSKLTSTASGYRLPPCYVEFGGTSGSTPAAAAIAALLISAAKQAKIARDLERLSWAMRSSGRYLSQMKEPIGYQGYGLMNVSEAWRLLSSSRETPSFSITSRSNGPHEDVRRVPHVGVGLYEYSGWHPGMVGRRVVVIRRQFGDDENRNYELRWRGNDGTFSAPRQVFLPLNESVAVPIKFTLKNAGIHQAILEIVDATDNTVLRSVLNTVVASRRLNEDEQTATWHARIPLAHEECAMFDVRPNTALLMANITIRGGPGSVAAGPSGSKGPHDMLDYLLPNQELGYLKFEEPGSKQMVFAHPDPGSFALCIYNHPEVNERSKGEAGYIEADIKLDGERVNEAFENRATQELHADCSIQRTADSNARGRTPKDDVIGMPVGCGDTHTVDVRLVGEVSKLDFKIKEGTQKLRLDFGEIGAAVKIGVFIYSCATRETQELCTLQDYREDPRVLRYNLPRIGNWKLLLYRLGTPGEARPLTTQIRVIQFPNKGAEASR